MSSDLFFGFDLTFFKITFIYVVILLAVNFYCYKMLLLSTKPFDKTADYDPCAYSGVI